MLTNVCPPFSFFRLRSFHLLPFLHISPFYFFFFFHFSSFYTLSTFILWFWPLYVHSIYIHTYVSVYIWYYHDSFAKVRLLAEKKKGFACVSKKMPKIKNQADAFLFILDTCRPLNAISCAVKKKNARIYHSLIA